MKSCTSYLFSILLIFAYTNAHALSMDPPDPKIIEAEKIYQERIKRVMDLNNTIVIAKYMHSREARVMYNAVPIYFFKPEQFLKGKQVDSINLFTPKPDNPFQIGKTYLILAERTGSDKMRVRDEDNFYSPNWWYNAYSNSFVIPLD